MMHRRTLLAMLLLAALQGRSQPVASRLDSLLSAYARAGEFNGTALIAFHGKVLLEKGYGYRNVKDRAPNTAGTLFQVASITKQFTAALILKLAEQHKLSLQDSIGTYFPGLPNGSRIMVEHLLTHTSGITDRPDTTLKFTPNPQDTSNRQKFLSFLRGKAPAALPGQRFEYSNYGYFLLGYLIEQMTGMTYFRALQRFIYDPLHMRRSCFDLAKSSWKDKATGYSVFSDSAYTEAPPIDPYGPFSAGAICSTVGDLYKWDRGLRSGRVISMASQEKAYTPLLQHYGYGWFVDSVYGKRQVAHDGGITGFNTLITRVPEDGLCVIFLNNKPGRNLPRITREVLAILYRS